MSDYEKNNNEDDFLAAVYAYLYLLKYSQNTFMDSWLNEEE